MTTTTTTVASTTGLILAIDLGKYKSVACLYPLGTAQATFDSITTSRVELLRLLQRQRPALVVLEACALACWVHDLCAELGLPCKVANTASEAWMFKHTQRKTDKDGMAAIEAPKAGGLYGVRVRHIEPKEGEHDGKKYKEVRHYATFVMRFEPKVR